MLFGQEFQWPRQEESGPNWFAEAFWRSQYYASEVQGRHLVVMVELFECGVYSFFHWHTWRNRMAELKLQDAPPVSLLWKQSSKHTIAWRSWKMKQIGRRNMCTKAKQAQGPCSGGEQQHQHSGGAGELQSAHQKSYPDCFFHFLLAWFFLVSFFIHIYFLIFFF